MPHCFRRQRWLRGLSSSEARQTRAWWPAIISSSSSLAAQRSYLQAVVFPCPAGESHTRSPLALPEVSLPEGAREDLAFEFRRCGATRVLAFKASVSRDHRLERRTEPGCLSKGRSPRGCRRSPGLRSKAVSGKIDTHFENHLWPSRHLDPEGRCPRSSAVPTVVQFSKQRQSGDPRACSGRLWPSRVSWPAVVGGFEDSRRPATGAR